MGLQGWSQGWTGYGLDPRHDDEGPFLHNGYREESVFLSNWSWWGGCQWKGRVWGQRRQWDGRSIGGIGRGWLVLLGGGVCLLALGTTRQCPPAGPLLTVGPRAAFVSNSMLHTSCYYSPLVLQSGSSSCLPPPALLDCLVDSALLPASILGFW